MKLIKRDIFDTKWWADEMNRISDWASDARWDGIPHVDCLELITDILGPYYKTQDVPGLEDPVDDEDVQTICEAIQGAEWDKLESAFDMIRDASQYAWEYAALPDEGDIESAAERAAELVVDDWDFVEDPWGAQSEEGERAIAESLVSSISYQKGQLILDPNKVDVGKLMRSPSVRRWVLREELPTIQDLLPELERLLEDVEDRMAKVLEDIMQTIDAGSRLNFEKQWKLMLADKKLVAAAREELFNFILEEEGRHEEEERQDIARRRREMEKRTGQGLLWEPLYPEEETR